MSLFTRKFYFFIFLLSFLIVSYGQSYLYDDVPIPEEKELVVDTIKNAKIVAFTGELFVDTDNGDVLPIYINGKLVGKTPYLLTRSVGPISVSFMATPLRIKIQKNIGNRNVIERIQLSGELKDLVQLKNISQYHLLTALASHSEQKIVIRNGVKSEVIFSIKEIHDGIKKSRRHFMLKAGIGSLLVIGGLSLLFTQGL